MNNRVAFAVTTILAVVVFCFLRAVVGKEETESKTHESDGMTRWSNTTTTQTGWPVTTSIRVVESGGVSDGFCGLHFGPKGVTRAENSHLAKYNWAIGLLTAIGAGYAAWLWATTRSRWHHVRLGELLGAVTVAVVALAAQRVGLVDWLEVPLWLGLAAFVFLIPIRQGYVVATAIARSRTEPVVKGTETDNPYSSPTSIESPALAWSSAMETELHQYARRMWCYGLLAGFSTAIATFSAFAAIAGPGDLAVFVMVISLSTALATGALAFAYVVGIVWETRHPISGIAAGFLMLLLGCLFGAGFLIVPRWVQNGLDRPANLCPIRPLPYSELG